MIPYHKRVLRVIGMNAPDERLRIWAYRKAGIKIGRQRFFGGQNWLDISYPNITIEDDVFLAGYDFLLSHSHIMGFENITGFIHIKKGVSIGVKVTVLPNVTIGENSVIGACSLVNKNIPDSVLACGVPAKIIRRL